MLNFEYVLSYAELEDIESWMKMVEVVKDNFPGLKTEEDTNGYREIVIRNIKRKTALCVKKNSETVGILIFSYNAQCLSCMAVHPEYRKNGIASAMVEKMLDLLPENIEISVSTFRENDNFGDAPRALYKKYGFEEGELTVEFGYPHQKFVLKKI